MTQSAAVRTLPLLITLVIAETSSAFEISMLYAALPTLRRVFADPVGVGWAVTVAFLVSALGAALCGRLGDLLGRRRLLLIVLVLCGCGSLISALSDTLPGIVVGAGLQGISGAILALCLGLARQYMPTPRIPFAIGTVVAAGAVGAAGGLVLGGALVDNFSWNAIFFCSASMAFVGAVAVWLQIPRDPPRQAATTEIDMLRGVLFVPAVGGILFAISKSKEWGWADYRIGIIAAASVLLLTFWSRHQLHQKTPLINLRLLADRRVATAYGCMALIAMGAMQIAQILSIFLQQPTWTLVGFGLTATASGAVLLPSNLLGILAGPTSGKLASRYGARFPLALSGIPIALAWVAVVLHHDTLWFVTAAIIVGAFGMFAGYAAVANLIVEAVPETRTSEATGLMTVFRATFAGVGAQFISLILATSIVSEPDRGPAHFPSSDAYQLGFSYMAVTGLLTLILAASLPRPQWQRSGPAHP